MVSCSSNEEPETEKPPHELAGTWKAVTGDTVIFTVNNSGNLNFNCALNKYADTHCNYSGKIADAFEYPYTIELTFTTSSHASITSCDLNKDNWFLGEVSKLPEQSKVGKFTFTDASTCSISVYTINRGYTAGGWVVWKEWNNSFKKQ